MESVRLISNDGAKWLPWQMPSVTEEWLSFSTQPEYQHDSVPWTPVVMVRSPLSDTHSTIVSALTGCLWRPTFRLTTLSSNPSRVMRIRSCFPVPSWSHHNQIDYNNNLWFSDSFIMSVGSRLMLSTFNFIICGPESDVHFFCSADDSTQRTGECLAARPISCYLRRGRL